MTKMPASEALAQFTNTLDRVAYGGERVILERHGEASVALVPLEDLAILRALEDRADLADAREALAEGEAIPWERAKAYLGL